MSKKQDPIGPVAGIIMLLLIGSLGFCVWRNREANDTAFLDCQTKGRSYYREIGSYPRFSTGELAEGEIIKRCKDEPWTFDGIK